MEAKGVVCVCFALFNLLVPVAGDDPQSANKREVYDGPPGGCHFAECSADQVCVYRRFRCRFPPCPGMLYCAASRKESLRGPSSCATVQCPYRHVCTLKVRRCRWDARCEQQIARCVSLKEFHEGPASCAGFECHHGKQCILRESFCAEPPCRLLRSCSKNKEVHLWLGRCRSLGCPSKYECFLRRPENNCISTSCKHEPDCTTTNADEEISEHCRGWMCPRSQKCTAEVNEPCTTLDCDVKRSCSELNVTAGNDSTPFSRRSLSNGSEVTNIITETSRIVPQGELGKGRDARRSWLDHLNSKTELDAIELWIKNAEEQEDFKKFQDWLRSIKNILDSGSYKDWLEEVLSTRGEEFRKWVRASHDGLDLPTTTSPGRERPRTVTENPYPLRDTGTDTPRSEDSNKRVEEIESLLRDKNLTSVLEKVLVPNNILLPPHTALETALLNDLRGSNRSLFFNYLLRYPFYAGNQFLSVQPPRIGSTYDTPYLVVPLKHIKGLANAPIVDQTAKVEQASIGSPNEEGPRDKPRYFDNVPADVLEPFLKSAQSSVDIEPGDSPTTEDERNQNFDSSSMPHGVVHQDRNMGMNQFSFFGDSDDRFEADPRISVFVDKLERNNELSTRDNREDSDHTECRSIESDDGRPINHSGQSNDVHSSSESNESNVDSDLGLLLELNKESMLPYIQTLMEAMNAEDDQTEPSHDETSVENFINDRADTFSEGEKSVTAEPRVTTVERTLNNENNVGRKSESVGAVSVEREKNSDPVPVHRPEQEPNVHQFYDLPSYGASNEEIPVQDRLHVNRDRANSNGQ